MNQESQQAIVHALLDNGILTSPDLLNADDIEKESLLKLIKEHNLAGQSFLVLTKDIYSALKNNNIGEASKANLDVDWLEFDGSRVLFEKKQNIKPYNAFLDAMHPNLMVKNNLAIETNIPELKVLSTKDIKLSSGVVVTKNYNEPSKKRGIKDYVSYYKHRYNFATHLLRGRAELQNILSINRLKGRQISEQVSLIGLVYDKIITRQGNAIITLEDATGHFKVFVSKEGPLKDILPYVTYDEVIGVSGHIKNNLLFAKTLLFPDIPFDHKGKTTDEEVYATFISDVHIGSKMFLEKDFLKFIDWLNGNEGTDVQRTLAKKIKYLFVVGDVIDGVGVYPNQESELLIKDVYDQYAKTKELLSLIREDIQIIMCPGNHDAVRIAEPQPNVNEFSEVLLGMKNLTLVSNPAIVNIHANQNNPGVDVLMYHGYSYDYYAASVEPIRTGGAYDRVDLIMKYLLQKRHLAPAHTSTLYLPCASEDPLLIEKIPDIFVSGHVHKSNVANYNGVLLIGSSCWQAKTSFQEKLGHNPDPGKVSIVNLKTREVTFMNFCEGEKK